FFKNLKKILTAIKKKQNSLAKTNAQIAPTEIMKIQNAVILLIVFLVPSFSFAGEQAKGTLILISSVSGWILLSSGVLLVKEYRRVRTLKQSKPAETRIS